MNCDEMEELLGAFALSALPADEQAAVRGHLATCRRHDEALAELRGVVATLPLAVEERELPTALRARLLAAFEAEVSQSRPEATPRGVASQSQRWFAVPRLAYLAAAAVLVLLFAGLIAWNVALQLDDNGGDGAATVVADFQGEGSGTVVYLRDQGTAILTLDAPEPPAGHVYQAWRIHEQGPASLGLMPDSMVAAFPADLSDASAVAVTVEPEGGSDQPTTEPLLVAELE